MGCVRVGVYAGTFDPPTLGHLWVIEEMWDLFDITVVAIATNPEKRPMFSVEARKDMLVGSLGMMTDVRVVDMPDEYLVLGADRVARVAAGPRGISDGVNTYLVRGIRDAKDFEYEGMLQVVGEKILARHGKPPEMVRWMFLRPPPALAMVSSSVVKSLCKVPGWEKVIDDYVTPAVAQKIKDKLAGA